MTAGRTGPTSRRKTCPTSDASARSTRRPSIPAPRTSRSRSRCSTTSRPTSSARTTSARPGRRSSTGIRPNDYVHVVREDPTRRGLLYAGTQHGVYVSFDDGDHWESLSLNLPDTQISDLIVEANSLAIATHGRGFYILDDIAPLRQSGADVNNPAADAFLYKPADAIRSTSGATIAYLLQEAGAEADDRHPGCTRTGRADVRRRRSDRARRSRAAEPMRRLRHLPADRAGRRSRRSAAQQQAAAPGPEENPDAAPAAVAAAAARRRLRWWRA